MRGLATLTYGIEHDFIGIDTWYTKLCIVIVIAVILDRETLKLLLFVDVGRHSLCSLYRKILCGFALQKLSA